MTLLYFLRSLWCLKRYVFLDAFIKFSWLLIEGVCRMQFFIIFYYIYIYTCLIKALFIYTIFSILGSVWNRFFEVIIIKIICSNSVQENNRWSAVICFQVVTVLPNKLVSLSFFPSLLSLFCKNINMPFNIITVAAFTP